MCKGNLFSLAVFLVVLQGVWGSSRIRFRRDSLRNQVAMLRAEHNRDRERIEVLERSLLVARGERNVPAAVPEWLGEILEELSQEIGDVALELRRRIKLEEMVEAIQVRQEQSVVNLRKLAEAIKAIQEHQKLNSIENVVEPWNEEGSGDFEESSLIPLATVKPSEEKIYSSKKDVEKYLQSFKSHQNLKLNQLEKRMDDRLLGIEDELDKVITRKDKTVGDFKELIFNVTEEIGSALTQMTQMSNSLSNISKHVSKVEFNVAQYQAALDVLERDWASDNKRIKEMQIALNQNHRLLHNHTQQLLSVELMATNISLQHCQKDGETSRQQVKMNNLEMRLAQTNLRIDSWTRHADSYRSSAKSTMYSLQNTITNHTEKVNALKDEFERLRTFLHKFIQKLPTDCSNVQQSGSILIQVHSEPVEVYCEVSNGRSWLVIQRRLDGNLNFFRNWAEYKSGFGNILEEFWIGNEVLHHLTYVSDVVLHIDMWDLFGRYRFAEYDRFRVQPEAQMYTLELGRYSGNATDSLSHHSGMGFSTHDRDNDASSAHCAVHHTGGWWYQHCHRADLNGRYPLGMTWYDENSHDWMQLQSVQMKIIPFSRWRKDMVG